MATPALAVHGGAGTIHPDPARLAQARAGLARALAAGAALLSGGGSALAAVEAAVRVLEDEPCFNAGIGSCLTRTGTVEMDAAVMEGAAGAAGAVAGITGVAHPVSCARLVLERTPHVLFAGPGAREACVALGAETIDPEALITPRAREELARVLASRAAPPALGTVGAVARDAQGRLAAATSTGGMTAKQPGRVGDSPLIGAGTWADRRLAISATGSGEYFIRAGFARRIAAAVAAGAELAAAAASALAQVGRLGGSGGAILVAADGPARALQDRDMHRGLWDPQAGARTASLGDEPLRG